MMTRDGYRWQSPYDWLMYRIDSLNLDDPREVGQLKAIAKLMATDLSADQIEDMFPVAMGAEGYYEQWVVCPQAISGKCLDDTCRHNEAHVRNECCSYTGVEECIPCRAAKASEVPEWTI